MVEPVIADCEKEQHSVCGEKWPTPLVVERSTESLGKELYDVVGLEGGPGLSKPQVVEVK
jgi:hypothetical protein